MQEEVGARGATTAGYGLDPEIVLAIDVTATGDFPQATPMEVALGKGPAIKIMDRRMIAHPTVRRWLENSAQDHDIPYQLEVLEFGSTDASAVQSAAPAFPPAPSPSLAATSTRRRRLPTTTTPATP